MFKGVDHVVIAVKDLDAAVSNYESIYDTSVSDRSEAPAAKADVQTALSEAKHADISQKSERSPA